MADNEKGFHHPNATVHGVPDGAIYHGRADKGVPMLEGITGAPKNPDPHFNPKDVGHTPPPGRRPANDMGPGLLPANGAINPTVHDAHALTGFAQEENTYGLRRVPHRGR